MNERDNMKKQSKFDKWYVSWMGKRRRVKEYSKINDRTLMEIRRKWIMADLELRQRQRWDRNKDLALSAWNAAQ